MQRTEEATIRYSRKIPDVWPDLLAASNQALVHSQQWDPSEQSIAVLQPTIEAVDNESLEACRYYSIGLIACEFAKKITIPEVKQAAVTWAAKELVDHHVWRSDRPHLVVGSVSSRQMKLPFEHIALTVSSKIGRAELFLANFLHFEADRRQFDKVLPIEGFNPKYSGRDAGHSVGSNSVAATATLYRVLLEKRLGDVDADEAAVDIDYLKTVDIRHAAACLATLRVDEFVETVDQDAPVAIMVDAAGKPALDRRLLPAVPRTVDVDAHPEEVTMTPLHENRLRCPAIHVQRLLPLMQEVVVSIIAEADKLVRSGEYADLERPDTGKVVVRAMPEEAAIIDSYLYGRNDGQYHIR